MSDCTNCGRCGTDPKRAALEDTSGPRVEDWNAEAEADAFLSARRHKAVTGEGDPYEFYALELRLAKVLGMLVAEHADKALALFDRDTGVDVPSEARAAPTTTRKAARVDVPTVLRNMAYLFADVWTSEAEATVMGLVRKIIEMGEERAGVFDALELAHLRPVFEQGIVGSAKYYTNEYFNRIVMPAILNRSQMLAAGLVDFDDEFFHALRRALDARLRSVPYWRLVAQQASSRSYHFGMARAGMAQGYRAYRLNAVLDTRTSEVCRNLNGREFWLADAVDHLEHIALTPPEYIAEEAPWVEYRDVVGASNDDLARARILTPPFHPHCRTTMDLVR